MFQLIGDVLGSVAGCTVSPDLITGHGLAPKIRRAAGAKDQMRSILVGTILLATETEAALAASVLIADGKVIEDVAVLGVRPALSTSQ